MPKRPTRLGEYIRSGEGLDGYELRPPPRTPADAYAYARLMPGLLPERPYAAADLVSEIEGEYADGLFFADSSFFDRNLDEKIWNALLSRAGRVVLLPQVKEELRGWLAANGSHPAAIAVAQRASPIEEVNFSDWNETDIRALTYYANLLGFRKRLYHLVTVHAEGEQGRPLTEREVAQAKQNVLADYGARAVLIARKGGKDDTSTDTYYTDEVLTATAFIAAIRRRRTAVILTRDQDIFDQFYKQQWLLDTHFRGMLLADAYIANLGRFKPVEMPGGEPWSEAFTGESNVLFPRSDHDLEDVLPDQFELIRVECWLLRDGQTRVSFNAEAGMGRLLDVKGCTGGLNTDRLAPRNCHIWLAPLPVPDAFKAHAAVAEDRRISLRRTPEVALPWLDVNQALMTGERYKRVHYSDLAVEPTVLPPNPRPRRSSRRG